MGEEKTRTVNVRIIAATNKQLLDEVKANRFRDDLFCRLNVFPVQIAPLRERKDDIQMLAAHFIDKISRKLNVSSPQLTQANIFDLQSYDWPGNVRELENAIERAIILSRTGKLNFSSVPGIDKTQAAASISGDSGMTADRTILSAEEIKKFERNNTINAMKQCNWKIYGNDGAAHLLGIKPTTLIERMKRMHIRKPQKKTS